MMPGNSNELKCREGFIDLQKQISSYMFRAIWNLYRKCFNKQKSSTMSYFFVKCYNLLTTVRTCSSVNCCYILAVGAASFHYWKINNTLHEIKIDAGGLTLFILQFQMCYPYSHLRYAVTANVSHFC